MSAFVIYRQLARRGHVFPQYCKDFLRARLLHRAHGKPEAQADEQEKEKEVAIPGLYRLHYKPNLYRRPKKESDAAAIKTEIKEDEQGFMVALPSRQQTNHYSVGSSRRLSSTNNKRLGLAVSKASKDRTPPPSFDSREAQSSDNNNYEPDPRAFQRCRPEYAPMTLDLSQRPTAIQTNQAFLLLNKTLALKSLKAADVAECLRELSHLHQEQTFSVTSDRRFSLLLQYLVDNLRQFSHPQLLQVLESFVWLDLPAAHSILGPFESELINRASHMSFHQLLLAADLCRCLGKQVPQFLNWLYQSIHLSPQHIGVAELVQLLYIIGEGRHCPKDLVGPIEKILMFHLDKLEPEEVGTVCLGLFKSQISLSQKSVACLVDKAHSVVEEMSDFAMVNVFKLLRFSHLDHIAWLEAMAREVPRRAPRMGIIGLMHVTLACSALHYRSDAILMSVAERLPSVAQQCRSKDSCKLLWSFGTLGILPSQCPEFYSSLIEAMRQRKAEFQRYPEHLLTGLLGLAFVAQFPEDLLTLALSPEFVHQASKKTQMELTKDLFSLDGTVGLELPHWTGPRMDVTQREEVAEWLWKCAQSDICQKPEVLEAEQLLHNLLGGKQFVCKRMILPHLRSIDLEVHLDSTGNPLPVNSCFESPVIPEKSLSTNLFHKMRTTGVSLTEDLLAQLVTSQKTREPSSLSPQSHPPVLHRVNKTLVKLAVQVSNRNHYRYHSKQLLGLHALKRRQLKLAGYRVVELNYWEWVPMLRKRQAEKLAYLHSKIYSSMDW